MKLPEHCNLGMGHYFHETHVIDMIIHAGIKVKPCLWKGLLFAGHSSFVGWWLSADRIYPYRSGKFNDTEVAWLPQCLASKAEGYGEINNMNIKNPRRGIPAWCRCPFFSPVHSHACQVGANNLKIWFPWIKQVNSQWPDLQLSSMTRLNVIVSSK